MKPPISAWRFIYIWSKRQLRIKANTLRFAFTFGKKKNETQRSGTHSKRKSGFLLQGLMLFLYIALAFNMSWQTLMRLNQVIPDSGNTSLEEVQTYYVDPFVYYDFTFAEDIVKIQKEIFPEKLLTDIRHEHLFEPKPLTQQSEKGIERFSNRFEKIKNSLTNSSFRKNRYTDDEADKIIKAYISNGMEKIQSDSKSSSGFKVDLSGSKSNEFLKWIGLYFLFCTFALALIEGIGNKNPLMMAPEDDLENLAAFPIKVWVLFLLPLLQRTFFNVMSILVSFPPAVCFFIALGHGTSKSIFLSLAVSFLFCLCTASLQVCYQYLGRYNSRKWLRTACSYMQLPGYAIFCLVLMGGQLKPLLAYLRDLALVNPGSYLPPALALRIFHEGAYFNLWQPLILCLLFPVLALSFIHIYSKGGLPSPPQENSKNRSAAIKSSKYPQCALRLVRDRNYFIQTVIFPIMLFSFYLFMFLDKGSGINGPKALSMLFGAASFIFLGSLLNIAAHEGPGLWLLFSASQPISKILSKSVQFWLKVVIAFFIFGLIIMFSINIQDMPILKSIGLILGLPSIAYIAASLSFSAYPPPSGNTPQKPKSSIIYFYMLLASVFAQSVIFGMPGSELSAPILFAFLAYALWQDNKRTLNYYLDPDYLPPREISAKNSMVWCILFFGAQSLVFMFVFMSTRNNSVLTLTISNAIASLIIASLAFYWYQNCEKLSINFDNRTPLSGPKLALTLIACAALFISFAWLYLKVLKNYLPDLPLAQLEGDQKLYFFVLAVITAPLIEEYLFRRLLLVALLKNLSPKIALISCALIFAAVHPISSFPPVFCLGLGASWIYWKSGSIWTAVLLHALYNAGVLFIQ